jgi:3-deoxy-D-manno-octulosonate 8-phosphate phosphatase (KDO 8-P phosphatase)
MNNLHLIKVAVFDVDGILTDGRKWQDPNGTLKRVFSVRDTLGLRALRKCGIVVIAVTSSNSEEIRNHLGTVGFNHFYLGCESKTQTIGNLMGRYSAGLENIALISSSPGDLGMMKQVGFSATASSATLEVRQSAAFTALRAGGDGAVAEICHLIISDIQHHDFQQAKVHGVATL